MEYHRMEFEVTEPQKLLVAAIDFGTTYSGYAFSLRHDYESSKDASEMKIYINNWKSGGQELVSYKTPTTILLDPNGAFDSFGYEAENRYSELAEDNEHEDWFYFKRFKMSLNQVMLNRNTTIPDINGQEKPALEIFTYGIRYLKEELQKCLDIRGYSVSDGEMHWVLTVPAIWNDSAKQFMKEAAQDAGIDERQLTIALEPEAASLFCQHVRTEKLGAEENLSLFSTGSKYLILDAGGGTVDITVHEIQRNGSLKELHKDSCEDWGGSKVDGQYKEMLTSFIKQDTMDEFCQKNITELIDLYREFETKKRCLNSENIDKKVSKKIPIVLKEKFDENNSGLDINEAIANSPFQGEIKWFKDKLQFSPKAFVGLFDHACDRIVGHVKKTLSFDNVRGTNTIVMVGGFSESYILQKKIKNAFSNLAVIIPQKPELAILKGAILFGWNPLTTDIASTIENDNEQEVPKSTVSSPSEQDLNRNFNKSKKKSVHRKKQKCTLS